jgi:hypothetical protein
MHSRTCENSLSFRKQYEKKENERKLFTEHNIRNTNASKENRIHIVFIVPRFMFEERSRISGIRAVIWLKANFAPIWLTLPSM